MPRLLGILADAETPHHLVDALAHHRLLHLLDLCLQLRDVILVGALLVLVS